MVRADRDSEIPQKRAATYSCSGCVLYKGTQPRRQIRDELYLGDDLTKKGCFILIHTRIQYGLVMVLGKIRLTPHRGSKKQGC